MCGEFERLLAVLDPAAVLRADAAAVRAGASSEARGATAVAEVFATCPFDARPAVAFEPFDRRHLKPASAVRWADQAGFRRGRQYFTIHANTAGRLVLNTSDRGHLPEQSSRDNPCGVQTATRLPRHGVENAARSLSRPPSPLRRAHREWLHCSLLCLVFQDPKNAGNRLVGPVSVIQANP